jgi:hypothetical protein
MEMPQGNTLYSYLKQTKISLKKTVYRKAKQIV